MNSLRAHERYVFEVYDARSTHYADRAFNTDFYMRVDDPEFLSRVCQRVRHLLRCWNDGHSEHLAACYAIDVRYVFQDTVKSSRGTITLSRVIIGRDALKEYFDKQLNGESAQKRWLIDVLVSGSRCAVYFGDATRGFMLSTLLFNELGEIHHSELFFGVDERLYNPSQMAAP